MHELSLSSAIIDTAVKHAGGRRVSLVNLRVGQLRQVVPETLEFYFGFVARGTPCEGARLEQEVIEPWLRCQSCQREWSIDLPSFRCPTCGGGQVGIIRGNEFEVESIDVEEAVCIGPR